MALNQTPYGWGNVDVFVGLGFHQLSPTLSLVTWCGEVRSVFGFQCPQTQPRCFRLLAAYFMISYKIVILRRPTSPFHAHWINLCYLIIHFLHFYLLKKLIEFLKLNMEFISFWVVY